ncbi:dolichyl-phosphate-mannose--protein mannosyltransferase, partial [Cylindrospermopsis raciborskii CS-506_B]|nr:dolichyl-phosphate-mannose--protein mannosyltransferase [Cylindrospermopsis raciborskii CS-506_B]
MGGSRSIQVRYELPLYICLEIAIAYIVSFAFPILQEKTWRRKIAQLMMVLLIFSGLVSDVKFFQSQNSWTQLGSTFIMETIQAINEADSPLLVINNTAVNLGGILA